MIGLRSRTSLASASCFLAPLGRALAGADGVDGLVLPALQKPLDGPVVANGSPEGSGFRGRDNGMDEPTVLAPTPFVVRTMSGLGIGGTPTARLPTDLRSGVDRSGTDIIEAGDLSLYAANVLQNVLRPVWTSWHACSQGRFFFLFWRSSYRQNMMTSSKTVSPGKQNHREVCSEPKGRHLGNQVLALPKADLAVTEERTQLKLMGVLMLEREGITAQKPMHDWRTVNPSTLT